MSVPYLRSTENKSNQITEQHQPNKRAWTPQEDEAILKLVARNGATQWAKVAILLQIQFQILGRTGKQCRERWFYHLNPKVNKQPWSAQQDQILLQAHRNLGNRWSEIAQYLPKRTDYSIKNHYHSLIRKQKRLKRKNWKLKIKRRTRKVVGQSKTLIDVVDRGFDGPSDSSFRSIDNIQPKEACEDELMSQQEKSQDDLFIMTDYWFEMKREIQSRECSVDRFNI